MLKIFVGFDSYKSGNPITQNGWLSRESELLGLLEQVCNYILGISGEDINIQSNNSQNYFTEL